VQQELGQLESRLGKQEGALPPQALGTETPRDAHYYKWLYRSTDGELDCAVPVAANPGTQAYGAALPASGRCATHVTARVTAQAGAVVETEVTLTNLSDAAASERRHRSTLGLRQ